MFKLKEKGKLSKRGEEAYIILLQLLYRPEKHFYWKCFCLLNSFRERVVARNVNCECHFYGFCIILTRSLCKITAGVENETLCNNFMKYVEGVEEEWARMKREARLGELMKCFFVWILKFNYTAWTGSPLKLSGWEASDHELEKVFPQRRQKHFWARPPSHKAHSLFDNKRR